MSYMVFFLIFQEKFKRYTKYIFFYILKTYVKYSFYLFYIFLKSGRERENIFKRLPSMIRYKMLRKLISTRLNLFYFSNN